MYIIHHINVFIEFDFYYFDFWPLKFGGGGFIGVVETRQELFDIKMKRDGKYIV